MSLFDKIKKWLQGPVTKLDTHALLRVASGENLERAQQAKAELRKRTDSASVQALIAAVASNSEARYAAARVLGEMKCSEAIPALLDAIRVPSRFIGVHFAADALIAIGDPAAAAGALRLLSENDPSLQRAGACTLGYVGSVEHVPTLIQLLETVGDVTVQRELAEALGRIGDKRADAALIRIARSNGDESSRVAAIFAVGKICSADTRGYLQMLTEDDHPGIRTAAVIQLGDYYLDAGSAGTLARIANDDPDRSTRELAIGYLKRFEMRGTESATPR